MRAGALHFFEKPFREHDLWIAMQEAVQLDEQRRAARLRAGELDERLGTLTEKEYAVLEMIAQGEKQAGHRHGTRRVGANHRTPSRATHEEAQDQFPRRAPARRHVAGQRTPAQ